MGSLTSVGEVQSDRLNRERRYRSRRSGVVCLAVWLCMSCEAWSAAPTLTNLFPAGGQRGSKVTVTCAGTFTWPVKVWAPGVEVVPTSESGKLEITIPADLASDRVWIRLFDSEGASASLPFLIGSFSEITETEPNNKPREANAIGEANVIVNGILKEAEVDCFAVTLNAGQTLVAAVDANTRLGSPMDAILQIATPDGIVLAENHDDLKLDPRLAFTARTPGSYIVRLFAFPATPDSSIRFNGGANHIYRLTLTTGPYVTNAVPLSSPVSEPGTVSVDGWNIAPGTRLQVVPLGSSRLANDQEFEVLDDVRRSPDARIGFVHSADFRMTTRVRLTPQTVATHFPGIDQKEPVVLPMSSSMTGCLKTRRQADVYRIPVVKGQMFVVSIESRTLDLLLDPVLKLADPTGAVISEIDDTGAGRDCSIVHTAAHDGEYRVTVSDRFRRGSDRAWYLLTVRLDQPDFELSVTSDSIVVTAEKPIEVPVKVQRRGPADQAVGPISVEVVGLPEGVTAPPVISETSGPTASEVKLVLSSTGAEFSGTIRITGKATVPKDIQRFARTPARLGVAFDQVWLTGVKRP